MKVTELNNKTDDPVILLESERKRILLDCGFIPAPQKIGIPDFVLISHGHFDHTIGIDSIVRNAIGSGETIQFFGPQTFIEQIQKKVGAYTWNLAEFDSFELRVTEIRNSNITSCSIGIAGDLKTSYQQIDLRHDKIIYKDKNMTIKAIILDHGIPSIGYSIEESTRYNINKERLQASGLAQGKWIEDLKQYLRKSTSGPIDINGITHESERLANLVEMSRGSKVVYLTDFRPKEDYGDIVNFTRGADLLVCESKFSSHDTELAKRAKHMTAEESAKLACDAEVKELLLVHFSKRYSRNPTALIDEAKKYFSNVR